MYLHFARLSVKTRIGYRFDFLLGTAGVILANALNMALLFALTWSFPNLGGWGYWELVFLYNLWLAGHGFYSTFFRNIENLQDLIVTGEFDRFLLKPVRPLTQLVGSQFYFFGAGDWIIASLMMGLAAFQLGLVWTWGHWLFLALTLLCAVLIETALSLALSALSFWFTRSEALVYLVFQLNYGLTQKYPIDLFPRVFQVILTFAAPFAFMNFFPGVILLNRPDKILWAEWVHYAAPLAALVTLGAAAWIWRAGLRKYDSTGS